MDKLRIRKRRDYFHCFVRLCRSPIPTGEDTMKIGFNDYYGEIEVIEYLIERRTDMTD